MRSQEPWFVLMLALALTVIVLAAMLIFGCVNTKPYITADVAAVGAQWGKSDACASAGPRPVVIVVYRVSDDSCKSFWRAEEVKDSLIDVGRIVK